MAKKATATPTNGTTKQSNGTLVQEAPTISSVPLTNEEILQDYRTGYQSRQASLIGRKEVLTGKAKFGIFGDGKEVAQLCMARAFQPGDIRSGYYRDQTFMFAGGMSNIRQFFSQLYAHADLAYDPASAGRQMNAHFATRMLQADGSWKDLTAEKHSSADSSPTASQMARMVGLAYASKLYRQLPELHYLSQFSKQGNEIIFGTIGDASTSEGIFWETINAIGVLQAPLLMSVWDDGYGISVPIHYQTTKSSISTLLKGFHPEPDAPGVAIYTVKGWDYVQLYHTYQQVAAQMREDHAPALIHVQEITQPQGHSTSGSHERYKSKERLAWEQEYDCLNQMRQWMIATDVISATELDEIEKEDKAAVAKIKAEAWKLYIDSIKSEIQQFSQTVQPLISQSAQGTAIDKIKSDLEKIAEPMHRDVMASIAQTLVLTTSEKQSLPARHQLLSLKASLDSINNDRYLSHLYAEGKGSALNVPSIPAQYAADAKTVDGREVLQAFFDHVLGRDPRVLAFGEDVGFLGDVNQAFAGMQAKYGELRVTDTGIREATIVGQGIGLAMRGLRPIAEIQYLDYLLYGLQIMSDDLACLHYRTKGGQKAPLIIRTRGHRLEGVWHSGSPMGMIIHALRGMHICVPRNMTQAAGMYNTLLQADDPALVVEVLNGYRRKEALPANVGTYTVPLGIPEVIRTGTDVTLVTYGACCRIATEAADTLELLGVSVEIIDVQTLLPFDREHAIVRSLQKTNRLLCLDEDVPGGASAFMLQQILEQQNGYRYLDSAPRTLSAQPTRPAYASDGDYFCKPSVDDVVRVVNEMMHEFQPLQYPLIYTN